MTPSNYVLWTQRPVEGACSLDPLSGFDREEDLMWGRPVAFDFSPEASFIMSADEPDNMFLTDNLSNIDMLLVVSKRLAAVLQKFEAPNIEYLPVTILDHRGRPTQPQYVIAHPINPVDCLDLAQSGAKPTAVLPSLIMSVERLVLDESRLDPSRVLFRLLGFPDVTLLRRDVAEEITQGGFTGLGFIEIAEYPGN